MTSTAASRASADVRSISLRRRSRPSSRGWFVVPAVLTFAVIALVPIAFNLAYSVTDWNGFTPSFEIVGFDNIVRVFTDSANARAVGNTLVFTLVNTPLQIGIGLMLALCLFGPGRLRAALRLILILPIAVSGVVLGFLGSIIFDPRNGILQQLSALPGLSGLGANWLGDPQLALGAVIAMNLWQWTGFTMLIFVAGLSTVPAELLEAATIDGAGPWRRFAHVTWPMLAPSTSINVILTLIGGFKVFDIIYVLTRGGPGQASESIVFRAATQGAIGQFGYSAATNLVLTIGIFLVSIIAVSALRRREVSA